MTQLELAFEKEINESKKNIGTLTSSKQKIKRGSSIKGVRKDYEIINDLVMFYTKKELEKASKNNISLSDDQETEIYDRNYKMINRKRIDELKKNYVAVFNVWPMLPHEVY